MSNCGRVDAHAIVPELPQCLGIKAYVCVCVCDLSKRTFTAQTL